MLLALAFGVIGYVARKTGYHVAAILIGIILGPLLEGYFIRVMKMSEGDITALFASTAGNILWVCLLLNIAIPFFMDWRRKRKKAASG